MPSAVIGVDIGTSASKGVLIALDGQVLHSSVVEHAVDRPAAGLVEMDAKVWWDELVRICRDLLSVGTVEVMAVGLSGMGPCVLVADEADEPLRPAILYGIDTRAGRQIERLNNRYGAEEILRRCGSALSSQAVGPKLAWIADEEPGIFARARRLYMPSSWLVRRLSGAYVLDHHSASQCTPLYDTDALDWYWPWAEEIALRNRPASARLAWRCCWDSHPDAAAATGLPAGIPVITGTIDAWAEALSVGAQGVGDLMLMYGTTMFLIHTVPDRLTSPALWGTVGALPGTRNLAGGMATSGAITSWLRDLFGSVSYPELLELAERSGVGASGLLLLPYFAGERTPIMDPLARGLSPGSPSRTPAEISTGRHWRRPATESGTISRLSSPRGGDIKRIVAVGGGTKGSLWTQVVSDITARSQEVRQQSIGASYGSALLAAQLVCDASVDVWNPVAQLIAPRPQATAAYDELYPLYRALHRVRRCGARVGCTAAATTYPPDSARARNGRSQLMTSYAIPQLVEPPATEPGVIYTIASGDLRPSANMTCWPAQEKLERDFAAAVEALGWTVRRGHPFDNQKGHGFIDSQRAGIEVFKGLPPDAPLVVVDAVWQYSHHVLAGLRSHRGPILVVANWSGQFPGLVGLLNLTGSLTKADVAHSALWSENFTDGWARDRLSTWLKTGELSHETSHVHDVDDLGSGLEVALGEALAAQLIREKAIIGVFDEGCMGMYNAIFDDELINPLGIYKERLSQSALCGGDGAGERR